MGSISERVHIKFASDHKPQEPTSTLVLTLPSGRFVDVRILKRAFKPSQKEEPSDSGYSQAVGAIQDLDWAFSGLATAKSLTWDEIPTEMGRMKLKVEQSLLGAITANKGRDGIVTSEREMNELAHAEQTKARARSCFWSHIIDSREIVLGTTDTLDQGIVFQTDVEGEELERGGMLNPATAVWEEYEELWRDIEIISPPWMRRKFVCWHCEPLGSDIGHIKSVFIRVGQFAQGILVGKGWVEAERWEADFEHGRWKCAARVGNGPANRESQFATLLDLENSYLSRRAEIDGIQWEMEAYD